MRSGNPALNDNVFRIEESTYQNVMTVQGTAVKTAVLLAVLLVGAGIAWHQALVNPATAYTMAMVGAIAGLILAMIIIFRPTTAPYISPFYAFAEGIFLGAISCIFEVMYPGIVTQAAGLTFGVLAALLIAYTSGLIRATENFKLGVVAATGGIFLVYMVSMVMNLFGMGVPYIHGNGLIGIGFSVFVVIIASLNLVLDFDFIENGAKNGAPKYLEWYGAFGLLVTLVWLYLEILRLLAKLQSRD